MHRMGGGITQAVPASVPRPGGGVQIGMSGQETPSESSEADSSECDTTGDEDGWESGESSASLMANHHSINHTSSRTQANTNQHHRSSLRECAKSFLSRGDKERNSQRQNATTKTSKRSSNFARTAALDT